MKNINTPSIPINGRRKFVLDVTKLAGAGLILSSPLSGFTPLKKWTVGDIIDLFLKEINGAPFATTVDTIKAGSREMEVKGIVTTMFATIPVIKQAIGLGANFIIAHEPTFYNHQDNTEWLKDDEVFRFKMKLLNDNKITVWRNHDYIHSHQPDGVYNGLLEKLDWKKYSKEDSPWGIDHPGIKLSELINALKDKLGIKSVRYIGDADQLCKKILLMPGAAGGQRQISGIGEFKPDVAIAGELQEWETAEYIRDARASGKKISLIVLGHNDSEDAGSEYMKQWLNKNIPEIKATHINAGNPFSFM